MSPFSVHEQDWDWDSLGTGLGTSGAAPMAMMEPPKPDGVSVKVCWFRMVNFDFFFL